MDGQQADLSLRVEETEKMEVTILEEEPGGAEVELEIKVEQSIEIRVEGETQTKRLSLTRQKKRSSLKTKEKEKEEEIEEEKEVKKSEVLKFLEVSDEGLMVRPEEQVYISPFSYGWSYSKREAKNDSDRNTPNFLSIYREGHRTPQALLSPMTTTKDRALTLTLLGKEATYSGPLVPREKGSTAKTNLNILSPPKIIKRKLKIERREEIEELIRLADMKPGAQFLSSILQNHEFCLLFRDYLRSTFSDENLSCYLMIKKFKHQTSPQNRPQEFSKIIKVYVRDGSPKQVNISAVTRLSVENLKPGEIMEDSLDVVEEQLFQLMVTDLMVPFVRSAMYKRFVQHLFHGEIKRDQPRERTESLLALDLVMG